MNKRLLILPFLLLALSSIKGQSLEDAVRYTLLNYQSTARSVGAGSGLGPMGVDFGAYATNPAGLGRLRFSEASLSLGANASIVEASYQGYDEFNAKGNVAPTLNNIGLGFANKGRRSKWKSRNFAISLQRIADFNRTVFHRNKTEGSITDRYLSRAEGQFSEDLDIFDEGLAFDVFAIDTLVGSPTSYFSDLEFTNEVWKELEHKTSGSLNELQLSYAGNYNDKLLVGFGLGIAMLDYTSERTYFEFDRDNEIDFFEDLTFTDKLETIGAGINLKGGLVYMPSRSFFVSLSGQTPTFYLLTDSYETTLEYAFDAMNNGDVFFGEVEPNEFDYRFNAPWRVTGGIGVIIKQKGFISAEVDFLDYRNARFDLTRGLDNSDNERGSEIVNADIDAFLQSTFNFRIGGEYTVDKLRLRAGFGISGSPFFGSQEGTTSTSLGFGYRIKKLILDFGIRATFRNELYFPYFVEENQLLDFQFPQPIIDNKNIDLAAVLTIGTKF